MKRPPFMKITVEYLIDTDDYDDDVDWSDPVKVIEDQIACAGLADVVGGPYPKYAPAVKIEVPKSKGEGHMFTGEELYEVLSTLSNICARLTTKTDEFKERLDDLSHEMYMSNARIEALEDKAK